MMLILDCTSFRPRFSVLVPRARLPFPGLMMAPAITTVAGPIFTSLGGYHGGRGAQVWPRLSASRQYHFGEDPPDAVHRRWLQRTDALRESPLWLLLPDPST